jgi:hypothetical protein
MDQLARVVELLGGEEVLGRKVRSEAELIEVIRRGLRPDSLTSLSTTILAKPVAWAATALLGPIGFVLGGPAGYTATKVSATAVGSEYES